METKQELPVRKNKYFSDEQVSAMTGLPVPVLVHLRECGRGARYLKGKGYPDIDLHIYLGRILDDGWRPDLETSRYFQGGVRHYVEVE